MKNKRMYFLIVSMMVIMGGPSLASAETMSSNRQGAGDQWITWRIDALLQDDNRFDYRDVRVTTKEGTVTLEGSVKTDYEKAHAALVAGDLSPVKGVVNDIMVWVAADPDIALGELIRSQIIQDPIFNVIALGVDAKEGAVTLHGIVRTPGQKKELGRFVQKIPGIKQLTNDLLVE
jgi:osmotically-inducible protein OsmY